MKMIDVGYLDTNIIGKILENSGHICDFNDHTSEFKESQDSSFYGNSRIIYSDRRTVCCAGISNDMYLYLEHCALGAGVKDKMPIYHMFDSYLSCAIANLPFFKNKAISVREHLDQFSGLEGVFTNCEVDDQSFEVEYLMSRDPRHILSIPMIYLNSVCEYLLQMVTNGQDFIIGDTSYNRLVDMFIEALVPKCNIVNHYKNTEIYIIESTIYHLKRIGLDVQAYMIDYKGDPAWRFKLPESEYLLVSLCDDY